MEVLFIDYFQGKSMSTRLGNDDLKIKASSVSLLTTFSRGLCVNVFQINVAKDLGCKFAILLGQ